MAREVTSKHLDSVSDLVLWAPIKKGFVDAFESVTFESRLKIVAKALFNARASAREYHLVEPFADVTARIMAIHSFHIAIPEAEERSVMLTVTFDRAWEPYMRMIWRPLGTFLDLIFCNCDDYPLSATESYEAFVEWVRAHQVDSDFFYATNGLSVADIQYMSQVERLQRERPDNEIMANELVADTPEVLAEQTRRLNPLDANEIALEALVVLYRLTDYYTPGTKDGDVLLRASRDLLKGWEPQALPGVVRKRFKDQLEWFEAPTKEIKNGQQIDTYDPADVQGGILQGWEDPKGQPNHGALLLLRANDPEDARRFLSAIAEKISFENEAVSDREGKVFYSLGVTCTGLSSLGVPEAEIARFPKEFREGMEDRAGLLGDVRESHPRRWALPGQNWPRGAAGAAPPIQLNEVDFVVELRVLSEFTGWDVFTPDEAKQPHPLLGDVEETARLAEHFRVRLLSVQSMRRAAGKTVPTGTEHFGFADGLSQPRLRTGPFDYGADSVALGEMLCGYANDRGDPPPANPSPYLKNGSFLVIRKLRQDVGALDRFIADQAAAAHVSPDELRGKMMGRRPDGTPLAALRSKEPNDFDFAHDPGGNLCPLQSHVRRANPRTLVDGRRTPRIMRRGMSYGPPIGESSDDERGTFFMAYNASIAEQFEVIQRWVNGGNSTGVASAQADPLMGLGQSSRARVFRFRHNGGVARVNVPQPFVSLQWGMYLFVPSLTAIRLLAEGTRVEDRPAAEEAARGAGLIHEMLALPKEEQALAWKRCIEDFTWKDPGERADGPAVWAAIRTYHKGVIRVPYGSAARPAVLVATRQLVEHVLTNDELYSMRAQGCTREGQDERMGQSFGHIFLGRDQRDGHEGASRGPNAVAYSVGQDQAFLVARRASQGVLKKIFDLFEQATRKREGKIDLRREFITQVLAAVSRFWFGFPDGPPPGEPDDGQWSIGWGGWSWSARFSAKPHCPGYFTAPSRYAFYPDPNQTVAGLGKAHGKALAAAAAAHLKALRAAGKQPEAAIANGLFALSNNDDEVARNLIGLMIGFLPPAEGNLRFTLYDWIEEQTLWRVQRALLLERTNDWEEMQRAGISVDPPASPDSPATPGEERAYLRALKELERPLMQAMQKRPAPDTLWRVARETHDLAGVEIKQGDIVIAGLVAATMEHAENGDVNVYPVFGGDRSAAQHPVHACPAYKFSMGTMLGMLSALLECGRIETLPAPLIVRLTELTPQPASAPQPVVAASLAT